MLLNLSNFVVPKQKDPPWTNRFIKRKRKSSSLFGGCYRTMDSDDDSLLRSMPVADLCLQSSLVAVWCTNSPTHLDRLINDLLPKWGLQYEATWFWIKVCIED